MNVCVCVNERESAVSVCLSHSHTHTHTHTHRLTHTRKDFHALSLLALKSTNVDAGVDGVALPKLRLK